MRDARGGGGPNKPELVSEHGAGQKPNKKPRTPEHKQRQVQAVVNDYAKNPRANAKKLRALGMSPKFIRAVHHSAVPNPKSEPPRGTHPGRALLRGLDTAGEYATGGLAKPSHFPGNILQSVGIGAHGLPHDKPAGFRRALTPEEFHRYQRTGHVPFDAAQMSVGMLPWGFSGSKLMGSLRRTPRGAAVSPEVRPDAAQKVMEGLKTGRAKHAYAEQKSLRHEELKSRVQKAEQALASGKGEEAFRAAGHELRGELPKTQFHGLRDMTDAEAGTLREHVQHHPDLQLFEKKTVWDAVRAARLQSKPPAPHEYRLMEKAFGPEITRDLFHPSNFRGHLKHAVIETVNIPRAFMSSIDLSAPGRQGLVGLISHPVISSKEIGPMVKAFASERHYKDFFSHLQKDPYYERALKDRLPITDVEHSLAGREEAFQSNYAEKITGGKRSPVRMSGRAYTRFLVGQRFGIYKHIAQHAEDAGRSLDDVGKNGQTLGEQIASLASSATGRGQGRRGGFFERNAVELNAALFSPRLIKSRLDFLNLLAYHRLDPLVRAEKMKMAVKTVAAISTFLYAMSKVAGVKVEIDPRSSDFGKIRIGNTRIDVGGGFNQYIRFIAQEVSNGQIDLDTGEVKHDQGMEIFNRFWRGKLSPSFSAGTNLVFRDNYAGRPLDWKQEVAGRSFPIALQDAKNVLDQTHSLPAAAAGYVGSAVGLGIQSHGAPEPTGVKTPDDLRSAFKQNLHQYFNLRMTPQIDKALRLREQRAKYMDEVLPKRPGRGASEDDKSKYAATRYRAQVDLMKKMRMITPAQARTAKRWAAGQDRHVVTSRTSELGSEYFGGDVLSSAAKKIRDEGGKLYLSDY